MHHIDDSNSVMGNLFSCNSYAIKPRAQIEKHKSKDEVKLDLTSDMGNEVLLHDNDSKEISLLPQWDMCEVKGDLFE